MKYDRVITGIFESRPNRFIAMVEITDPDTGNMYVCKCHVKKTMQCNELLNRGRIPEWYCSTAEKA